MEEGEEKSASPPVHRFSTKEDPLPWNETIVEDRIRVGVAGSKSPLKVLPITQVMDGHLLFHSFPVCRNGKGYSPVFFLWQKGAGGNDQDLICHRGFGDMHLGSPDHDPIALPLNHMNVQVRVFLLARPLHPVTFHVGLRTTTPQVLFLKSLQP